MAQVVSPTQVQLHKHPVPFWSKGDVRTKSRFQCDGYLGVEDQACRRKGRNTEVLHRFCREPIPWYKKVEPMRPQWRNDYHWYTEKDGIRVKDTDLFVVPSRDILERTRHGGLVRSSNGEVTYSASQRLQFELDAEQLARIIREVVPYGTQEWSLDKLEKEFYSQIGRRGCWVQHSIPLNAFVSLFTKTFYMFGHLGAEMVRVQRKTGNRVEDNPEDVMIRLALASKRGCVERQTFIGGSATRKSKMLPELSQMHAKTKFKSQSEPKLRSIDETCRLPSLRLNSKASTERQLADQAEYSRGLAAALSRSQSSAVEYLD